MNCECMYIITVNNINMLSTNYGFFVFFAISL